MNDEHFARAPRAAPWGEASAAVELCSALTGLWPAVLKQAVEHADWPLAAGTVSDTPCVICR